MVGCGRDQRRGGRIEGAGGAGCTSGSACSCPRVDMTGVVAEERSIISGLNDRDGRQAYLGIRTAGSWIPTFHHPPPLRFPVALALHASSAFLMCDIAGADGDIVQVPLMTMVMRGWGGESGH